MSDQINNCNKQFLSIFSSVVLNLSLGLDGCFNIASTYYLPDTKFLAQSIAIESVVSV